MPTSSAAPPEPARAAPAALQRARALALVALMLLVLLCLGWEAWWAPTGGGTLALKAVPLALCLPGLLRHRLYTYRWLSLLLWLYVTEGLVRSTSDRGVAQSLAIAEVGLSLLLFALCVHYIRLRVPRRARAGAPAAGP